MVEIFKSAGEVVHKPDWLTEMENAFESARSRKSTDIASIQTAMDAAISVYKEGPREGLKRFLNPIPGKIYCGLDREGWQNKIERLTPDIL